MEDEDGEEIEIDDDEELEMDGFMGEEDLDEEAEITVDLARE